MGSNDLAPAYLAFFFCIADILFVLFFMPETLKPADRSKNFTNSVQEAFDLINPTKMFTFRSGNRIKMSLLADHEQNLTFLTFTKSGTE